MGLHASPPPDTRRHEALYFDEGDVVLSVSQTQSISILYRLDTAVLSRHSPVFAGMFSLPSTSGVNEEYEGVPLVRLSGDSPSGIEGLFKFMYNPA